MAVSPTSLLSCLASSAVLTVLAWAVIKKDSTLKIAGKYSCIFLTVIVLRMLLPVEFGFTVTLLSRHIMTCLRDMMFFVINFGTFDITVGQILLFLWIAGAVAGFFIRTGRYIYFTHFIEKCPGYFRYNMEAVISRINGEYRKTGKFEVLFVPNIQAPAVFGLVRPKILMPGTAYTEEEIYYILKHEMLHYYHHDMLVKILCEILCTIYWWNPAVFLLRKLITRILEIRVDCLLTSEFSGQEKIKYLECMIKSMKEAKEREAALMIPFAAQKRGIMMQRFQCVLENHWVCNRRKGFAAAACSCLLFILSVSFIVEPWYGADVPGTFGYPDPETSYLIEKDGCYEAYIDGELIGEILEITEPFTELQVYKNKEDLPDEN